MDLASRFGTIARALREGRISPRVYADLVARAAAGEDVSDALLPKEEPPPEQLPVLTPPPEAFVENRAVTTLIVPPWEASHAKPADPPPQALTEEGAARSTLIVPPWDASSPRTAPPPPPPATPGAVVPQRFVVGDEIGRGGLGRVVAAEDAVIGRTVALKLLHPEATKHMADRFRRECRITGRLEHPNIVPIHDVGHLPDGGSYLCMKRISGRNMREVLRENAWPLRRLMEAFRDVCRAVAYAHSRGVVHRDLKPSNVMLGDFGEVLVVDWGTARDLTEADVPSEGATEPDASAMKTAVGEVVGTPAYMAPEQALGRHEEIDERSDVYALGATLYEILCGRPPFDGPTAIDVIRRVAREQPAPPSRLRACPAELETICLRAMAKSRDERFGSVAELGGEVQSWLEGAHEAERREHVAAEQVALAESELARAEKLDRDARAVLDGARDEVAALPKNAWIEQARTLWKREDRSEDIRAAAAEARAAADAALETALAMDAASRSARALKARIHWERFVEAEAAGDRAAMTLNLRAVERYNDGDFDARLAGDGTLEVKASAYACACLGAGRPVAPGEFQVRGFHPWSGRPTDGRAVESEGELEKDMPATLRVHAPSCGRAAVPARAWAFRFEEVDRMLVPTTPGALGPGVPEGVLDALYGRSPFRPRGGGIPLGATPVARRSWPMGSWLLVVVPEEGVPFRVPFEVRRQQDVLLDLTVLPWADVPDGFFPVSAGPFHFQGDRGSPGTLSPAILDAGDFLLARFPVTCREYAAFLNDLRRADPAAASARAPRAAEGAPSRWPVVEPVGYVVPTAAHAALPGSARLSGAPVDWEEDWPVFGISWGDACAYARWLSLRTGRLHHVPHEVQWERAARGADARPYPWGVDLYNQICNLNVSHPDGPRPAGVDSFPLDESPFGIRGLGGNSRDWCLNDPGEAHYAGWRIVRGGNWVNPVASARAAYRAGAPFRIAQPMTGFRLACAVVLPGSPMESAPPGK